MEEADDQESLHFGEHYDLEELIFNMKYFAQKPNDGSSSSSMQPEPQESANTSAGLSNGNTHFEDDLTMAQRLRNLSENYPSVLPQPTSPEPANIVHGQNESVAKPEIVEIVDHHHSDSRSDLSMELRPKSLNIKLEASKSAAKLQAELAIAERSRRAASRLSSDLIESTAEIPIPAPRRKLQARDFKEDESTNSEPAINNNNSGSQHAELTVSVPKPDDENFNSFFVSQTDSENQIVEDIDLDAIESGSRHLLSTSGVDRVRVKRRIGGSRNPLRALAARTDLRQDYTEPVTTSVTDKEVPKLKRDKVGLNSRLAAEALAGLASTEDFTAVRLKKTSDRLLARRSVLIQDGSSSPVQLVHVKGRRYVQVRLVEPTADSINSGDCFVLVTPDNVFNYNGLYANVIERSRSFDVAHHIIKDLGYPSSTSVITLDEKAKNHHFKHWENFWNILGINENVKDYQPTPAGDVDEDELFESIIVSTNMCYEVINNELIPIEEYWHQIPKISVLDPSKILVFDFGSELYVWNGKNSILENRRKAFQLAQELWDKGFNYEDYFICPLSTPQVLGGSKSEKKEVIQKDTKRPKWAIITKVTQHMETILFKDKFLDWPDFSRIIKVKEVQESVKASAAEIVPCDAGVMWNREFEDPSLILEGSNVGRGIHYFDKKKMKDFDITTKSIVKWVVQEYDYLKVDAADVSDFYSSDSYIVRWEYQIAATGRELDGSPSKFKTPGRDRCAYFFWQGKHSSINEKGAAALLTVELDKEKGPQVRVTQDHEPPAFLNLFKGSLVIHQGKKGSDRSKHKLYMVRGNIESESHLNQVACSTRQLRSRASMILVDSENGQIYIWHGIKSLNHTKAIAVNAAKKMASRKHVFDSIVINVVVTEIEEGDEPEYVIDILGGANRELYYSLLHKQYNTGEVDKVAVTPRLFRFTDLSGKFEAVEVLSPLRHESLVTPYPFLQEELYSASQPGLFLLDCGDRLWLWQGWWPQKEDSESIETASGMLRWQMCRRAAMETVLDYWKLSHPGVQKPEAYLAIAGLEPLPFTNMFDEWQNHDDIAELNIARGEKVGEGELSVSVELCRLTRTSFPLAELRQRPLPQGVDPAHVERHLTPEDLRDTFEMSLEEFYKLPEWHQINMKKIFGLF